MDQQEMTQFITKAVGDGVKNVAAGAQEALKKAETGLKKAEETAALIKGLEEKVAKIEALPALGAKVVKSDFGTFLGEDINKAVSNLQEKGFFKKEVHGEDADLNAAQWAMFSCALVKSKLTGDHSYMREFAKASNTEGVAADGGYLVPKVLQPELIRQVRHQSFAMQKCTVFPMTSNEHEFPAEADLVKANFVEEGGESAESKATFGKVSVKAQKIVALTAPISRELLQDSVVAFMPMLTEQMVYSISQRIDEAVLFGVAGDTEHFQGICAPSTGISAVTLEKGKFMQDVKADDFSAMLDLLEDDDEKSAEYVFHKYLRGVLRTLKDSNGRYIYCEPTASDPSSLWGQNTFTNHQMPGASDKNTAGKIFAALGNWKKYYIGVREGTMSLDLDPYTNFGKDMVRARIVHRVGGNPVRKSAFAVLKAGAAAA